MALFVYFAPFCPPVFSCRLRQDCRRQLRPHLVSPIRYLQVSMHSSDLCFQVRSYLTLVTFSRNHPQTLRPFESISAHRISYPGSPNSFRPLKWCDFLHNQKRSDRARNDGARHRCQHWLQGYQLQDHRSRDHQAHRRQVRLQRTSSMDSTTFGRAHSDIS